jgi:hypothetical protein
LNKLIEDCNRLAKENPGTQFYIISDGKRQSVTSFEALMKMFPRHKVVYAAIQKENK